MFLWISNQETRVQANDEEISWLTQYLQFEDGSKSFFMANGQAGFAGTTRRRFYNYHRKTFPSGLTALVYRDALKEGFEVQVIDERIKPAELDPTIDLSWLQERRLVTDAGPNTGSAFQYEAVLRVMTRTRGLLWLPTGSGKCLAPETPVLLQNGNTKLAGEVIAGDVLMGPDSTGRKVTSTTSGEGPRYRITPSKGSPWECNDAHVLTLQHTTTHEIVDIPLDKYLQQNETFKHTHKLFCVGVDFPPQDKLAVDPYFVGVWIGDGRKGLSFLEITKEDPEIISALHDTAKQWQCSVKGNDSNGTRCTSWRLVTERGQPNELLQAMRILFPKNDRGNRGPILKVLTGSREERLQLLAGVVDTDGHQAGGYYEVCQKPGQISNAIAFVARSLGFRVTHRTKVVGGSPYDRWNILGEISQIPTRIPQKRAPPRKTNKKPTRVSFQVMRVSEKARYAGFTVDGDGRFLLGDFTVTHNTEISCGIMKAVPALRWLFLAPEADLMHNAARRWQSRSDEEVGLAGDGHWPVGSPRVVCATFQTLARRLKDPEKRQSTLDFLASFQGMIVDECHQLPADDFYSVALSMTNAYYRIGMSGTALSRGDKRNMYILAALGEVIYRVSPQALMAAGWISQPTVRFVPVTQDAPQKNLTYVSAYKSQIVRSAARNRVLVGLTEKSTKPCLLFVKYEEHGQILLKELKKRGNVTVEFMHGKHSIKQRDAMLERVRWGDTEVIIATKVLQTGTDIPELASLVIGTAGASNIEAVQRVGRGMRVMHDSAGRLIKSSVDVWEVFDTDAKKKNPTTGRMNRTKMSWFEDHAKQRKRSYESEGYPTILLDPADAIKFGGTG